MRTTAAINPQYTENSVPTLATYEVGLLLGKAQATVRTWIKQGKLDAVKHTDGTMRVSALSVAHALHARYNGHYAPSVTSFKWKDEVVASFRENAERLAQWSGELAPRMLIDADEHHPVRLYSPTHAERGYHAAALAAFKVR